MLAGGDVVSILFRANMAGWQPLAGDWIGPAVEGGGSSAGGLATSRAVDTVLAHLGQTPADSGKAWSGADGSLGSGEQADALARQLALLAAADSSAGQPNCSDQIDQSLAWQAVDVILARLRRLAELGQ